MSSLIHRNDNFFCYELVRPNGETFYVGVSNSKDGEERRLKGHLSDARRGVQSPACDVIREIVQAGEKVGYIIVQRGLTRDKAFTLERERIALHGRDNLANRTSGGTGPYERVITDEQRAKLRSRHKKNYYSSPEYRQLEQERRLAKE